MKKTITAGACIVAATCFLAACGDAPAKPTAPGDRRPPPAEGAPKIAPPEQSVGGLNSTKEATPDMGKSKKPAGSGGGG